YVHRSGRTGRADKLGISIAIIHLKEKYKIKDLERQIKQEFTKVQIPTGKEVCTKQLFNMIDKVENVDVNYAEIETFLPDIMKKLEGMDKEELIRKFVSLEFNRFLEYYRGAPDLNVDESRGSRDRDDRGGRDERGRGRDRGDRDRGDRDGGFKDGNFQRLFISIGHKDKVVPQRIIGMINDFTQDRNIEIGKIDILDNFSYIEVGADKADIVIEAFKDQFVQGRPITVEIAQPRNSSSRDRGGSDRRSGGRSSGGSDRRSSGSSDRRSSGTSDRRSGGRSTGSSDRRSSGGADRRSSDRDNRSGDRKRY
ncbi:MAG: DbpA RNA binding domain-containing protein, partial [Bacteroidales bacterium]|nr:DbpA RNA binding domain-containing protein [Bacteroidales bacterium]